MSLVKSTVVGHYDPEKVHGHWVMAPSKFALPGFLLYALAAQLAGAVPTVRKPGIPCNSLAERAHNPSAARTTLRTTRLTTAFVARPPLHTHLIPGRFRNGIAVQIAGCLPRLILQPPALHSRGSRLPLVRIGHWCCGYARVDAGPAIPIPGVSPRKWLALHIG